MIAPAETAAFIGGFVAAEGTFTSTGRRFRFAVALAHQDHETCQRLSRWFGVGRIYHSARRSPQHADAVVYQVQSLTDLVAVIVPFMEEHLPASHKRDQFEAWSRELLSYVETRARRRGTCGVSSCSRPHRAKGLCRQHYFTRFRR